MYKVACGLTGKPKELIDEIDAADTENQLAVVDYIEDIYKFYKSVEVLKNVSFITNWVYTNLFLWITNAARKQAPRLHGFASGDQRKDENYSC